MIDDELKKIWQDAPLTEKIKFNHSKLLIDMENKLKDFERKIKMRDYREIGVALFLIIPYFSYLAYQTSNQLLQAGAIIIVLSCFFIIYKLQAVKKYKKTDMTASLKEQMLQIHQYLRKEKALLDNVLTWYILPPNIGLCLFFIGKRGWTLGLGYMLVFQFIVMALIYWVNQKAVKTHYTPMIEQLEKVIAELP